MAAGLPSWERLLEGLADTVDIGEKIPQHLLDAEAAEKAAEALAVWESTSTPGVPVTDSVLPLQPSAAIASGGQ